MSVMEHSHLADLNDKEIAIEKSIKGATFGLAVGTVWGTVAALLFDHPALERNVAHPDLARTLRACGNYGLTCASLGGIYSGVDRLLEKRRMKKDFVNGSVSAFAAGATVFGLRGRSISAAVVAGSALALTSMVMDFSGLKACLVQRVILLREAPLPSSSSKHNCN